MSTVINKLSVNSKTAKKNSICSSFSSPRQSVRRTIATGEDQRFHRTSWSHCSAACTDPEWLLGSLAANTLYIAFLNPFFIPADTSQPCFPREDRPLHASPFPTHLTCPPSSMHRDFLCCNSPVLQNYSCTLRASSPVSFDLGFSLVEHCMTNCYRVQLFS